PGPGLAWRAAVGVRKGKGELKAAIERALAELRPDIARLADKYGFPTGAPIPSEPPAAQSAPVSAEAVRSGRSLFNQHCSHCHAPNAMSPEPSRDLRRLRLRYGDRMREITFTTVVDGRPTKGMPTWRAPLSAAA